CAGVGEVAVVAQGQRARGGGAESGLSVLPGAGAGGGVAGVPQGDVPGQGAQRDVVEDLGDQPHVLVDEDLLPVAGGDPGGLLAAVLQSVQPEVGELGDLFAGGPDAEDTAGVLRALLAGEDVVRELTVTAYHGPIVPHRHTPPPHRPHPATPPHPHPATPPVAFEVAEAV